MAAIFAGVVGASTIGGALAAGGSGPKRIRASESLGAFAFLEKGRTGPNRQLFDEALSNFLEFLAAEEGFEDVRQRGIARIGTSLEKFQEKQAADQAFGFGRGGALSRNASEFTRGIAEADFDTSIRQRELQLQLAKGGEVRAIQNFLLQAKQLEGQTTSSKGNPLAGAFQGAALGLSLFGPGGFPLPGGGDGVEISNAPPGFGPGG